MLWGDGRKVSLWFQFALLPELRVKEEAAVDAQSFYFPSLSPRPALPTSLVSGLQWGPRDLSLGQGSWAPPRRARVEEEMRGRIWGRTPAPGTLHGKPSPNKEPRQPCLKAGCEDCQRREQWLGKGE